MFQVFPNLRIERTDSATTLWIDVKNQAVNTLTRALWNDLDHAVASIESEPPARLVIASAKKNSFIAGADLKELSAMTADELRTYLRFGQAVLNRLEALPCETIAAINGHALGGGLEVALACKFRIAAGNGKFIGLPETTLGLIPGWGGTQRLPRLVGLSPALEMLVDGKSLSAAEALAVGVVDRVCTADELLNAAKSAGAFPDRTLIMPDERDEAVFERFFKIARRGSGRHLPAPSRAIEVARVGWEQGIDAGFAAEIDGLVELRDSTSGRHLLRNFFLRNYSKSTAENRTSSAARSVQAIAVIGGGTMGVGIAHAFTRGGQKTVLIEVDELSAAKARARVESLLADDLSAERLSADKYNLALATLIVSSTLEDARHADFVIEAIVEKLDAKVDLFRKLDQLVRADAIIASNTSSLSISTMANATEHPSRFVGVHFFNPVPRMQLVEIAAQPTTDAGVLQTANDLIRNGAKKTPVVVNDGPGFIVNRVLMPYLSEALRIAEEGVAIEEIDAALVNWGMPVGPIALIDTIGVDVTAMILASLRPHLGERVFPDCHFLKLLQSRGELGRKAACGFYVYSKERSVAPTINRDLSAGVESTKMPEEQIVERTIAAMSAEAVRTLDERVATSFEIIDIATLLGMGFPAFRGGLGSFLLDTGGEKLLAGLTVLQRRFGDRFAPPQSLARIVSSGQTIAALQAPPMK